MRDVDAAVSPRQLSADFGLPLSSVAYHVRVLARCNAIKLVEVKPAGGSVQHMYRYHLAPAWARQIIDLELLPGEGAADS